MLTPEELNLVDDLGKCMVAFDKLPRMHPDEVFEFKLAIHRLQDLIAIRCAQRVYPDRFATYTPEKYPELYEQ